MKCSYAHWKQDVIMPTLFSLVIAKKPSTTIIDNVGVLVTLGFDYREYFTTLGSSQMDYPLRWRHNGRDGVSNHQPHYCLLNRLFRRRSKKTLKLDVPGLCAGNSPGSGEFPAQMASDAENVSISWRHHVWGCEFVYVVSIVEDLQY